MKKFLLAAGLAFLLAAGVEAQTLLPNAQQQFLDANGTPLAGGFVFTYSPGTTTPKMTWQDPSLSVPNSNPVLLDSAGEARIWGLGVYRQVVLDANSSLVWDQQTSALVSFAPTAPCTSGHVVTWGSSGGPLGCDPAVSTVLHDLNVNGAFRVAGSNSTNAANTAVVDVASGTVRWLAFGPDLNTPGNWQIGSSSSDSSVSTTALSGGNDGVVFFGTGFRPARFSTAGGGGTNVIPPCNNLNLYLVIQVTDATTPTYNGNYVGGSNKLALAVCDGANWKTH